MHQPTVDVYERRAGEWVMKRKPRLLDVAESLAARVEREGMVADLGCGPGWYSSPFGARAVALDGAMSMLRIVPDHAPDARRVQADLGALPFRRGALAGALGSKSYVHLARSEVPMALADLHRSLAVGAPAQFVFFFGDHEHDEFAGDDFGPGRRFSTWSVELLDAVVTGAGFEFDEIEQVNPGPETHDLRVAAVRARTLSDTVGPSMRLLVCGLNPAVYAADAGVGFARPGNRFWPAALAAGLVTRDRDPVEALRSHGIGMTDIVKRATPRADVLTTGEYRDGMARLERMVTWLQPGAICFVGLTGWRAAVDKKAVAGTQQRTLGGRPVYLMPSTSGVNAHASLTTLTDHLAAAANLADRSG